MNYFDPIDYLRFKGITPFGILIYPIFAPILLGFVIYAYYYVKFKHKGG